MKTCAHWSVSEVGSESDGSTIYQCDECSEVWNGGSE